MLYLNDIVYDHTYIRYIYTFYFSKYQTDHFLDMPRFAHFRSIPSPALKILSSS